MVGVSQIKNTFIPYWRENDNGRVWDNFEHMLFGNMQKHDHVLRFHLIVEEV
jgi:hypothetical protein